MNVLETDVLVGGGGLAGLCAAPEGQIKLFQIGLDGRTFLL
jgi:hypothetical protein